ncbi:Tetracycline resistance protein TetA/multidrug resistance protein MdtG [Penicillium cinerascens]|uniref:Tetracycline resistance protein TetA/multidrug resistance protein MdtG n=1 Tax=Penicillium cinerascens TaxID=70096 RepID=A0A9W9N9I4_9EURO|nr:Tetracycline resistance protein TetA/multidrug resistance protein MdtG [Penicillium cinerascens]KAJ5215773.1 Tetracycline resistance protein TetA/multidrug resistance protein MdtG [Penicillium cinerascens]
MVGTRNGCRIPPDDNSSHLRTILRRSGSMPLMSMAGGLTGFITDRFGARFVAFGYFLCPAIVCLRFAETNSTSHIVILITLLFVIDMFTHVCGDAAGAHGDGFRGTRAAGDHFNYVRGSRAAGAQVCGCLLRPLGGGFVEYRFVWGVMSAALRALAAFTAMPMLWLDEKEEHDDERQPLFSC